MKKILFLSLLYFIIKPCLAKDGSISLKEAIQTRHYIFGAELLTRTKVKKEIFYTVLIKDIIKGNLESDTVKLRFMYESEGREYVHDSLKFVICIVDKNSTGTHFEDWYSDNIRSFESIDEYNSCINYYREANIWISTKDPIKKKNLKSNWIAKYISDSVFKNEIFYDITLHQHDYGTINSDAQQIVKNEIIKHFDEDFSTAAGIHFLSGKYKKEVLDFILAKLDVNDLKKTCSIMDILWYVEENKGIKLHYLWSECCDGKLKSIDEYQVIINKFKIAAR